MSVLWCGGEDIDFPNGASIKSSTNGNYFRGSFARCAICPSLVNTFARSIPFAGGAVTSLWATFRFFVSNTDFNSLPGLNFGLGNSSTTVSNPGTGLYVGIGNGPNPNFNCWISKYDQSTGTCSVLASSNGGMNVNGALTRLDVQVANYGTSGTVTVYINGSQAVSYTGDLAVGGISSLDTVILGNQSGNNTEWQAYSEIIVADESTLGWQGLVTCAPNGNGTTQQWQNPSDTNYNEITITDSNSAYTNVVGQDEQSTIIPVPTGNFAIKAVKTIVRANGPAGSVPTGIKVGFNNGTTVAVGPDHLITTAFAPYEDLFTVDPTTGAPWATLAGYLLSMRSA